MDTHTSYCRICQAFCGVEVDVLDNRIVHIRGDRNNPMSGGYTCPKGRRAADFVQAPRRLVSSLKRQATGGFTPIAAEQAATQIARQLQRIIAQHGPDSVGMFLGTQGIFATLTNPFARSWFGAIGSRKLFTTMTIDQSAKWVASDRMGEYRGGRHSFSQADVWMLVGTNPLVSVNGGAGDGVLMQSPSAALAAAQLRGLKLIVIDPRRTETASRADIHIAPRPGHDALIFAGLLNIILSENLHDADFCGQFATGLDDLIKAVRGISPAHVAAVSDIREADLIDAARMFARGPKGAVSTGTGVCMGPHSNLAEHLAMCLNAVCGRFQREGDQVTTNVVLGRDEAPRAEVSPPSRTWETGYQSRLGAGLIRGELPSSTLSDEILIPGPDRVRAMIVSGGNPVLALPNAAKALRAFSALELLVVIDPHMSATAQLADYVIAPTTQYERPDHTITLEKYFAVPYAMYTDPVIQPPPGVIEDWQFFWHLARAMDVSLSLAGKPVDMKTMPSSGALLSVMARTGRIPLDLVAGAAHGLLAPERLTRVAPASPHTRHHRLHLLPDDVREELRSMLAGSAPPPGMQMQLVVRRMREVMNSHGCDIDGLPRQPFNPAFMHPEDMARLGLQADMHVRLKTAHGSITAQVRSDTSLRAGIIAISHGWSTDKGAQALTANVNGITGTDDRTQSINHMPQLTAQYVEIARVPQARAATDEMP